MAKSMSFLLRWGNSCGIPFLKDKFCDENAEWDYLRPYLEDRPQQQWTEFSITKTNSKKSYNISKKNKIYKFTNKRSKRQHKQTVKKM